MGKAIKCKRDQKVCDLNRGAKSCRHGPWAGQCFDRLIVNDKPSKKAKVAYEEPKDDFSPEMADAMAAQEAEDLAREQAEHDEQEAALAAAGPEGGDC